MTMSGCAARPFDFAAEAGSRAEWKMSVVTLACSAAHPMGRQRSVNRAREGVPGLESRGRQQRRIGCCARARGARQARVSRGGRSGPSVKKPTSDPVISESGATPAGGAMNPIAVAGRAEIAAQAAAALH